MTQIINVTGIPTIDVLDKYENGRFRFITKTRAGYISCHDAPDFQNPRYKKNPEFLLTAYKKGVIQSIQFLPTDENDKPEHEIWLTVFARQGKKIHYVDEAILRNLKVAAVNQFWYNTQLFSTRQYGAVNTKTWDSYVFRQNSTKEVNELENALA